MLMLIICALSIKIIHGNPVLHTKNGWLRHSKEKNKVTRFMGKKIPKKVIDSFKSLVLKFINNCQTLLLGTFEIKEWVKNYDN